MSETMKTVRYLLPMLFIICLGCPNGSLPSSEKNTETDVDAYLCESMYVGTWKVDANNPKNQRLNIPLGQGPWIELRPDHTFQAFAFPISDIELDMKNQTLEVGTWTFKSEQHPRCVSISLMFTIGGTKILSCAVWTPDFDGLVVPSNVDSGWIHYSKVP